MALRRARDETRHVLKEGAKAWAPFSCPGTAECCQLATTKRPPWLWPSEWGVLLEHLRRAGRPLPPAREDGGCPFLDAAGRRCSVYEARPLGCRTYFCHRVSGPGAVPAVQTNALLERLAALNLAVDDEARPRSLLDWWAEATGASSVRRPGARRHHDQP